MDAGFADRDITPRRLPLRTYLNVADKVMDPLWARAAVFHSPGTTVAFVALDVVIVERAVVEAIRRQAQRVAALRDAAIMVSATHNHACPAVIERPSFRSEPEYIEFMVAQAAGALEDAARALAPVDLLAGSTLEANVSFNRRFVTRDGCVRTQPSLTGANDNILYREGPIDPEVGVLAARKPDGALAGLLVNFGCHACHHMGQLSAGYPGVMARELRNRLGPGVGVVFLNGPCGNVIHRDYLNPAQVDTMEVIGTALARAVERVLPHLAVQPADALRAVTATRHLPYRDFAAAERAFARPEVQRNVFGFLISKGWYDYAALQRLAAEHGGGEDVEIQTFRLGDTAFVAIPAEYFCEFGLRIKERSPWRRTWVASVSNGWVGYVPTREAFQRPGGHETTTALWSKMSPESGDAMADTALELLAGL